MGAIGRRVLDALSAEPNLIRRAPLVVLLAVVATFVALAASRTSWLAWLEHWSGDWRTAALSDRPATQHRGVAIVAITEETLDQLPYRIPVDRGLLARVVSAIDRAGAKAIGLDLLFVRPTEPAKDEALVVALKTARARVAIAAGDGRAGLTAAQIAYQDAFIARTGARPGYANLLTGGDQIVRYLAPPGDDGKVPESFAEALAGRAAERRAYAPRGPLGIPLPLPVAGEPIRIAWLLKPSDGSDAFPVLPAHVLATPAGGVLGRLLKDRLVIVGTMLPDVDRHLTPLPEWEGDEVAGVIVQAQVAAQIADGRSVRHVSEGWLALLLFALALPAVIVARRYGIRTISIFSGGATLAVLLLDLAVFHFARQVIPFGACLTALAVGAAGGAALDLLGSLRARLTSRV
ncbi:MAG: CHASE2 domain-containing protein [Hyphomicrobiaceae bacterium]